MSIPLRLFRRIPLCLLPPDTVRALGTSICLFLLVAGSRTQANILQVGPSGFATVAAAMAAAAPGDTIDVAPGIYTDLLEPPVNVTVRGTQGAAVTILDGEGSHRILQFDSRHLVFQGVTFRHGSASSGGAVFFQSGFLRVEDCTFADNLTEG